MPFRCPLCGTYELENVEGSQLFVQWKGVSTLAVIYARKLANGAGYLAECPQLHPTLTAQGADALKAIYALKEKLENCV